MPERVSQASFHAALLEAKTPAPPGLTDGQGRPAGRRFDIYRNNVAVSLSEALADSFPVIQKLLGDENFRNISALYIRQHPPNSPLMMFYGADFADFLAEFPPLAHLPYLPDVARLEQALREAYHAADAAPIAPEELADVPAEALADLRLSLAPPVRVLHSEYPIHAIWAYNTAPGGPKPEPVAQSVLVVRPDFDPIPLAITAAEADCLQTLQTGESLGAAVERASARDPKFDLSRLLGLLLSHATITSLSRKE